MASRKVNSRKQKLANERAQKAGFKNDYVQRKYLKKYAPRPDLPERQWLDVLKGKRGQERIDILKAHNNLFGPGWRTATDTEKFNARGIWYKATGDTKRLAEMKARGYEKEGDWEAARAIAADIDIRYLKYLQSRIKYLIKVGIDIPADLAEEYDRVSQMIEDYPEFLDEDEE